MNPRTVDIGLIMPLCVGLSAISSCPEEPDGQGGTSTPVSSTPTASPEPEQPTSTQPETAVTPTATSTPVGNSLIYSEDFERSERDLEHEYGHNYYASIDEMADDISNGYVYGFVATEHSTVFALLLAVPCSEGKDEVNWVYFDYVGEPINLMNCTSGALSLDWGVIMHTSWDEFNWSASISYRGVGYDDSAEPEGDWSSSWYWTRDDGNGEFGPATVGYPLDYDCGYTDDGSFQISVRGDLSVSDNDNKCTEDYVYMLTWIDNLAIDIQ